MNEDLKKILTPEFKNVMFFLLGMAYMAMSSTWMMSLIEKYNIVEHKIEYTNVEVKVPAIIEKVEPVTFSASDQIVIQSLIKNRTEGKRNVSAKGIEFIRDNEGYSAQAYFDVNGITVGYGHKINQDDPEWLRKFRVGTWIQKSYADILFAKDINNMVNDGINYIIKDLENNNVDISLISQNFIDGLGDMIYNCGLSGVMSTEFYSYLKKGNINKAISVVPYTKVFCEAHKIRRNKTKALMETS